MPFNPPDTFYPYMPDDYPNLLNMVLSENSSHVEVRGMKTVEKLFLTVGTTFTGVKQRIHFNEGRWENPIFGYAEGLFILLGIEEVEPYAWYAPQMAHFADRGAHHFHGAYGPRLGSTNFWGRDNELVMHDWLTSEKRGHLGPKNQLEKVYQKLKNDPTTRQAVMTIWNPILDNTPHKDIPCTIMFQFLLRNNYLHLNVHMRSQDMMTGFVYDTQQFKWFQEMMAGWLQKDLGPISLGNYVHTLGSAHIYEKDLDMARHIINNKNPRKYIYSHYNPYNCGLDIDKWKKTIQTVAKIELLSRKGKVHTAKTLIDHEDWYQKSNIFYYEMAVAILATNMAKHGYTIEALNLSERLIGELTIPTLCRLYAYHKQKTDKMLKIKGRHHPDMISLIKQFVFDKAGTLKMVD